MLSSRVAVCFSGQLRTGVETAPALRKFIGEMWNSCDFFVHTWDVNTRSKWASNFETPLMEVVDSGRFDLIKSIYNPISMSVDKLEDTQKQVHAQKGISPAGQLPMLRSIYNSNLLKIEHEQYCHSKYMAVLRLRFDQVFDQSASLLQELQYFANAYTGRFLHTCDYSNKLPYMVEDIAWLGRSDSVDIASKFLHIREAHNAGPGLDWQTHLKIYLEENGILPHHWKNNNLFIYRDYHASANISPFATELLV